MPGASEGPKPSILSCGVCMKGVWAFSIGLRSGVTLAREIYVQSGPNYEVSSFFIIQECLGQPLGHP